MDGVSQHCFLHKLLILQLPSDGHSLVSWNFAQGIHSLPSTEMRKYIFKKDFIYLLLERREGKEKERERNMDVQEIYRLVASPTPPTGDLVCNPGMHPDWESNQQPVGYRSVILRVSHTSQSCLSYTLENTGAVSTSLPRKDHALYKLIHFLIRPANNVMRLRS